MIVQVTVDFLAYQARELTRSIISDKVLCRSDSNFAKLTAEVFEDLPRIKLNDNQTLRYMKIQMIIYTILTNSFSFLIWNYELRISNFKF
jgi:hypothetical protein